jgi:hypothetical protein
MMRRVGAAVLAAVCFVFAVAIPAQATSVGSNGRIAYWYGGTEKGKSGIYTIRPDGTGRQRLTSAADAYPAWSPDGRRIAFSRNLQIWLMGRRGHYQRRVTSSSSWNVQPTFSRDGETLAFVSNRTGSWNIFELASRRPYGHARQITTVTGAENRAEFPSFAPDGSLYWIQRTDAGDGSATFAVMHAAADGSGATVAYDCFSCWGLDVSPGGGSLLYTNSSQPLCGRLGRYNLVTGHVAVFPDCVQGLGLVDADFSPNERRLVSVWFGPHSHWLVTTDRNGLHRRRLPGTALANSPAWQPVPTP